MISPDDRRRLQWWQSLDRYYLDHRLVVDGDRLEMRQGSQWVPGAIRGLDLLGRPWLDLSDEGNAVPITSDSELRWPEEGAR